ncbi:MAG: stalk domain-containing protein [Clostridiales bacterium]|nr:stalk domain-containing protein [Clostridiales bacterium]
MYSSGRDISRFISGSSGQAGCRRWGRFFRRAFRALLPGLLLACLLAIAPGSALADLVIESDIAPSLLAAVKDVTGTNPVFPLQEEDEFFKVSTLDLNGKSVTSLKGIRYFTELTRLTAEYNRLTTLKDVLFPDNIRFLSLAHNNIADVAQAAWPARLRTLDLRNNRLTNPLDASFPEGVSSITMDNNFLTSKYIGAPRDCSVSYAGNFIYEANSIRPATLIIREAGSVSFSPGEQKAIPFVNITSSTNPNNQVPPKLLNARILSEYDSPVHLAREEYRFLLTAQKAGSDYLIVELTLTNYLATQYESMNQTFYQVSIPITVWLAADSRPGAASSNNGDAAVLAALNGHSSNAVADMTRFNDGRATFSPGLLAQLANQDQKLILSHDFGNVTLDPKNLRTIANEAAVSSYATVAVTLSTYEARQPGFTPSRFSDKQLSILPSQDFYFSMLLQIPGSELKEIDLGSPVSAMLYLKNQNFTQWDFGHLTAFKDNESYLDILGGVYNPVNVSFTYQLYGSGRFGLGTRGTLVQWIDLAVNGTQFTRSDGTTGVINPAPIIHRGSTMVPLRSVFEEMGAIVTWQDSINSTTISYGSKVIYITEGRAISGSDQTPIIINDRMLVPLRLITTEFGATVLWWSQDGRIRIVY